MSHSTVSIGTAFEKHAAHFLNTDLRMAVRRVGGRGDAGVDLRGYWWLPKKRRRRSSISGSTQSGEETAREEYTPPPAVKRGIPDRTRLAALRVVAQCKATRGAVGPVTVRELEGTLGSLGVYLISCSGVSLKPDPEPEPETAKAKRATPHVGVLVSRAGFTSGAMAHASRSARALLLVHLPGGAPGAGEELEGGEGEGEDEDKVVAAVTPETEPHPHPELPDPKGPGDGAGAGAGAPPPPEIDVAALWWNRAFTATLPPTIELRRELSPLPGASRVGIWYAGGRMGRYGVE